MTDKYELLENDSIEYFGHTLYRIRALKDFGIIKKDELGGYINKNNNLSQSGKDWIFSSTKIYSKKETIKTKEPKIIENKARKYITYYETIEPEDKEQLRKKKHYEYCKKYYLKNKAKIEKRRRELYENDKDEICKARKELYANNYEKNKDEINKKRRIWREKNRNEINKKKRDRYLKLKLSKQKEINHEQI